MKGVVAYDSVHGSTKQVAEAIAEEIKAEGHQVDLIAIREGGPSAVAGDFMFIGSPTRGGRMTKEAKEFVESLDIAQWKGKPIVAFDTLGPISKDAGKRQKTLDGIGDWSKNAASRLRELCQERGLSCSKEMHFAVVGFWGPLAPEMPERARELTRQFLASLG